MEIIVASNEDFSTWFFFLMYKGEEKETEHVVGAQ